MRGKDAEGMLKRRRGGRKNVEEGTRGSKWEGAGRMRREGERKRGNERYYIFHMNKLRKGK